jgi:hypothetical protein
VNLLDIAEATSNRDDGIRRASEHANSDWRWHAEQAVMRAARKLPELIADDVQLEIPVEVTTHEGRALGAVMLAAVKAGILEKTERFKASANPRCHRNPRRIWRSLVYQGAVCL